MSDKKERFFSVERIINIVVLLIILYAASDLIMNALPDFLSMGFLIKSID